MEILRAIEAQQIKADLPDFGAGDTVKVHIKVTEGKRERIQIFEGVIIKRQGGGIRETFTVRKISSGVGVERTFAIHSPKIDKIEVKRLYDKFEIRTWNQNASWKNRSFDYASTTRINRNSKSANRNDEWYFEPNEDVIRY